MVWEASCILETIALEWLERHKDHWHGSFLSPNMEDELVKEVRSIYHVDQP